MRALYISVSVLPLLSPSQAFSWTKPSLQTLPKHSLCISRTGRQVTSLRSNVPDMNWDPFEAPKLDFDECYYEVLEIKVTSSAADIKKAFYRLVSRFHPDAKETEEEKSLANKQMMVLNNAYKILKDEVTRASYDVQYRRGLKGSKAGIKGSASNSYTGSSSSKKQGGVGDVKDRRDEAYARRSYYYTEQDDDQQYEEVEEEEDEEEEEEEEEVVSARPKSNAYDSYSSTLFDQVDDYLKRQQQRGYLEEDEYADTSAKRAKQASLIAIVEALETELKKGGVDWGEVTNQGMIERRLRDINALNALRLQLQDLEYEIVAEDEEREFRRGRERDIASFTDASAYGAAAFNSRSPWRQSVEKNRNPKRRYNNKGNEAVIEELLRLRKMK